MSTPPSPPYVPAFEKTIAALRRKPKDPYWCRRLVELFKFCDQSITRPHRQRLLAAMGVVASHDPWLLISEKPTGVRVHWGLAGATPATLRSLERRIKIRDESVRAYVLAMLWLASVPYGREAPPEPYRRAAQHLARVKEPMRNEGYWEMLSDSLAQSDYATLKKLAPEAIEHTQPIWRTGRVQTVLEAAVVHEDWATYEDYRAKYSELAAVHPPSTHDVVAVLNLDGVRALRTESVEELARIMDDIITRAPHVQFLGTPETLMLANELADHHEHPEWVQRFLAIASIGGRGPHVERLAEKLTR